MNRKQRKARAKRIKAQAGSRPSRVPRPERVQQPGPDEVLRDVLSRARGRDPADERRVYAEEVARLKQEIATSLRPFDPLHALAAAFMHFGFGIGSYVASLREPNITIEYLATVLLEQPDAPDDSGEFSSDLRRFNEALMGAHRRVRLISGLSTFESLTWRREPDPWKGLRALASGYRQGIRGCGYGDDERSLFCELTAPVAVRVSEVLGVSPDTALGVFDKLVERLELVIERRLDRMFERVASLKGFPVDQLPRPMRMLGPKRRRELVKQMAFVEAFLGHDVADDLLFTAGDLAPDGAAPDAVAGFLSEFVTEFGSVRGTHFLPRTPAIVAAPLVRRGDRCLATSPSGLLHALRPRLEQLLKPTDAWPTYDSHRAGVVEGRATDALAAALRVDELWMNVGFDIDGSGGWEADGILRCDELLLIVEAKAGALDFGNFRDGLRRLVGRAATQTARLRVAIQEGQSVFFHRRSSREPLDVDLARVTRVETIAVTLEDLSFLNGHDDLLVAAGLAPNTESIPWLVNLFDLEQICDLCEFPAQLTLYLRQRGKAIERAMVVLDELDLWLCFLKHSLNFPSSGTVYLDTRFTEALDAYRLDDGPRPTQPFDTKTRAALVEESSERRPGFVERSEAVISRFQATRTPPIGKLDFATAAKLALGPAFS